MLHKAQQHRLVVLLVLVLLLLRRRSVRLPGVRVRPALPLQAGAGLPRGPLATMAIELAQVVFQHEHFSPDRFVLVPQEIPFVSVLLLLLLSLPCFVVVDATANPVFVAVAAAAVTVPVGAPRWWLFLGYLGRQGPREFFVDLQGFHVGIPSVSPGPQFAVDVANGGKEAGRLVPAVVAMEPQPEGAAAAGVGVSSRRWHSQQQSPRLHQGLQGPVRFARVAVDVGNVVQGRNDRVGGGSGRIGRRTVLALGDVPAPPPLAGLQCRSQGPECLPVQPQLSQGDPSVVLNVGHPLVGFPQQGPVDLQRVVPALQGKSPEVVGFVGVVVAGGGVVVDVVGSVHCAVGSSVATTVPVFAPACIRVRVNIRVNIRTLVVPRLLRQSGSPRHGQPLVVPSLRQRERSLNDRELVPPLPPVDLLLPLAPLERLALLQPAFLLLLLLVVVVVIVVAIAIVADLRARGRRFGGTEARWVPAGIAVVVGVVASGVAPRQERRGRQQRRRRRRQRRGTRCLPQPSFQVERTNGFGRRKRAGVPLDENARAPRVGSVPAGPSVAGLGGWRQGGDARACDTATCGGGGRRCVATLHGSGIGTTTTTTAAPHGGECTEGVALAVCRRQRNRRAGAVACFAWHQWLLLLLLLLLMIMMLLVVVVSIVVLVVETIATGIAIVIATTTNANRTTGLSFLRRY